MQRTQQSSSQPGKWTPHGVGNLALHHPWAVRSDEMTQLGHRQVCAVDGDQPRYAYAAAPLAPVTSGIDGGSTPREVAERHITCCHGGETTRPGGSFLCRIDDRDGRQADRRPTSLNCFRNLRHGGRTWWEQSDLGDVVWRNPDALRSGPAPLAAPRQCLGFAGTEIGNSAAQASSGFARAPRKRGGSRPPLPFTDKVSALSIPARVCKQQRRDRTGTNRCRGRIDRASRDRRTCAG
jgi:hypothetical protein